MPRHASVNAWSNAAYALASVPFFFAAGASPVGALAALAGLSLLGLAAGSWAFHALSDPGPNHRAGHVADHIGMHAVFTSVAAFVCAAAFNLGAEGLIFYAALVVFAALVLYDKSSGDRITLRRSYKGIGVESAFLLAGLVKIGVPETALVASVFAIAFAFRHHRPERASGFGDWHAVWHVLTAVGFVLCAVVLA